jgi:hypothetical protein
MPLDRRKHESIVVILVVSIIILSAVYSIVPIPSFLIHLVFYRDPQKSCCYPYHFSTEQPSLLSHLSGFENTASADVEL